MNQDTLIELRIIKETLEERNKLIEKQNKLLNTISDALYKIYGGMS